MNGKYHYVTSFEIIKFDDNYIELLQEVEVENKMELRRIEGENIRKHDCVNKCIAGSTRKETDARYYQANKEQHTEQMAVYYVNHKEHIATQIAKYYQENKETILAQQSTLYTCACGLVCTVGKKARHEKSKKHQAFVTQSVIPSANIL